MQLQQVPSEHAELPEHQAARIKAIIQRHLPLPYAVYIHHTGTLGGKTEGSKD
jgi:hypothetical protein